MLPRRHFLQLGLTTVAAIPVLGGLIRPARAGTQAAPVAVTPLHLVAYDQQIPESVAFARAAAAQGARTVGFAGGDATAIWYEELDLQWRERPVAIAGLTRHGPLFVFEQMAQARGLRVIARAAHSYQADGRCEHVVAASPEDATAWVSALEGNFDQTWPTVMAGLVTSCNARYAAPTRARVTTPAHGGTHDEQLYSWVIAPVSRA
jgi:hypothetical protein